MTHRSGGPASTSLETGKRRMTMGGASPRLGLCPTTAAWHPDRSRKHISVSPHEWLRRPAMCGSRWDSFAERELESIAEGAEARYVLCGEADVPLWDELITVMEDRD